MPQIQARSKRFNHLSAKNFCCRLLVAAGLARPDAELVADSLVESNLRGIDSHGIARLPHYLRRIEAGSIRARPNIRSSQLAPATCLVDGDHGQGQLVMWRAAGESVRVAQTEGAGWAAVCNSSHCGALSYYGLRIAEAGMIGLVFTHVSEMIARWGSLKPVEPGRRVLYPGEPEVVCRREKLANGVPLGLQLVDEFNELARHYGVPPLEDRDTPQQVRVDLAGSVEPPAAQVRSAAAGRDRSSLEAGKPAP